MRYLETLQKYANQQKEFNTAPQLQNPSESTAVLAVAETVKQMAESVTAKPHVSGLERLSVPSWDSSLEERIQALDE